MKKVSVNVFWFRRDLRLDDNAGLKKALTGTLPVLPIFIFDKNILDDLDKNDARVEFIHNQLASLNKELKNNGSSMYVAHSNPLNAWKNLIAQFNIKEVFVNKDYEPYARKRDNEIAEFLRDRGIDIHFFKDHVIFEESEIKKPNGSPYLVFTPYSRTWLNALNQNPLQSYIISEELKNNFWQQDSEEIPSLHQLGFSTSRINFPKPDLSENLLKSYERNRDYPYLNATSNISIHLRFGTMSIRAVVKRALEHSKTFLNELIWREFYQMILWHFPQVVTENFNKKFDKIIWRNNSEEFSKWCKGKTGYPMVDAGMRQLNKTGFMHNRVRMITASFLCKHLLVDWRWGEAYFADKLLDYELASNNGGWQWAASTGADAVPYFRIFNPELQEQKFDPKREYIKKWIPEIDSKDYPKPIVDHKAARERAINAYKMALS